MTIHHDHQEIDFLSGYLLFYSRAKVTTDWLGIILSAGCSVESPLGIDGWYLLNFVSNVPLLKEPTDLRPPFVYKIVLRTSGKKALLLSPSRKIVNHILDVALNPSTRKMISKIFIDVDSLSTYVTAEPDEYLLTLVHARVNAFGDALNAVSFYGDDISRASLFREQRELFTAYSCGIRSITSKDELIRLGSSGYISFYLKKSNNGSHIDTVLRYINDKGFLRTCGYDNQ